MNTAGIIINKSFRTLSELETALGASLKSNIFSRRKGKVFFLGNSTLIVADSALATDPFNIKDLETASFVISTTTNSYALNLCKNNTLTRSLICFNDERIEDFGDKVSLEDGIDDVQAIVHKTIENILGTELLSALESNNYNSIDLNKLKSQPYSIPKIQPIAKPTSIERSENISAPIANSYNDTIVDSYFDRLTSENENNVLDTIDSIDKENINKPVLSFLLNLAHFHWSLKVRRRATKAVESFASNSLWEVFNTAWNKKYFPKQMYRNRNLLNHPEVDASEYFVFAQANRRNYFNVKPKKGDVAYMSSRYNDEAENIFECYNVDIEYISNRISKLQNIGSANFRNSPNLNWDDTVEKLSELKNLHFLQIAKCGLATIPSNFIKLQGLKKLILEEEGLKELPANLKLGELSCLDIKDSKINLIDFKNFPKLNELWIDGKHKLEKMQLKNLDREVLVTSGRFYSETIK